METTTLNRIIRAARPADMTAIMSVMAAAKQIMRQSGNMQQWGEGYPSEAVIRADMEKAGGYVIEDEERVAGYFAFLPSPEPTSMWFIGLPAIRRFTACSAASWTSVSGMIRISGLIPIAPTPSCSTT